MYARRKHLFKANSSVERASEYAFLCLFVIAHCAVAPWPLFNRQSMALNQAELKQSTTVILLSVIQYCCGCFEREDPFQLHIRERIFKRKLLMLLIEIYDYGKMSPYNFTGSKETSNKVCTSPPKQNDHLAK